MSDPNTAQPQEEQKLLLEMQFCPDGCRYWMQPFYRKRFTQCVPMKFSLKCTNIGNSPIPGAVINNFTIFSNVEQLGSDSDKTINMGILNPNESTVCDFGIFTINFKGSAWVSADIKPINSSYLIRAFQHNTTSKPDSDPCKDVNSWGDTLYIQGELEYLQHITNMLILFLTAITLFEALFGFRKSIVAFFRLLGVITRWAGDILLRITQ